MEKGLWEKSIFFSSSFHSYIGKSTIQQNSNTSVLQSPKSSPTRMRAAPGELRRLVGLVAGEEHRVARLEPALATSAFCAVGGHELGDRPLAGQRLALALEDDVAETRRALALRPVVELVEERARLLAAPGAGIARTTPPALITSLKALKPRRRARTPP